MKDWQKSLLGGLVIGSVGVAPVLFWLAEIRVRFRCPGCGEQITAWKKSKQVLPQLEAHSQGEADEESEETSDRFIASAPTV